MRKQSDITTVILNGIEYENTDSLKVTLKVNNMSAFYKFKINKSGEIVYLTWSKDFDVHFFLHTETYEAIISAVKRFVSGEMLDMPSIMPCPNKGE